jgi:hypothetical protein
MGLPKGKTNNPGGRPKGSPNRATEKMRCLITDFLDENFEQVSRDMMELEPKDRVKFYIDLLSFGLPRLQNQQVDLNQTNENIPQPVIIASDEKQRETIENLLKDFDKE